MMSIIIDLLIRFSDVGWRVLRFSTIRIRIIPNYSRLSDNQDINHCIL